jgi:hypothetical protein
MLPQSAFASPRSSFAVPVAPPDVDPTEGPFVYVKINTTWLPYVLGSLKQLAYQTPWKTTTLEQSLIVQARALNILQMFVAADGSPLDCLNLSGEEAEMSQLRVDCNGVAHFTDCNGTEYTLDLKQVNPSPQPGPSPQPSGGGGSHCYEGTVYGNQYFNIPTSVNAGDVVTIAKAEGAFSVNGVAWKCPDGHVFFAGACVGSIATDGANIAPALPTGALIIDIGGTFYLASEGQVITVPGGVSAAQLLMRINSPGTDVSTNSGSARVEVCVQNNQAGSFTHVFDFKVSDGGFVGDTVSGSTTTWVPGSGWHSGTSGAGFPLIQLHRNFSHRIISTVDAHYNIPSGDGDDHGFLLTLLSSVNTAVTSARSATGTWDTILTANADSDEIAFNSTPLAAGAAIVLDKITVTGIGSDPF